MGEEVCCFQGNQGVWGPLGLTPIGGVAATSPSPAPLCPTVLLLGVECSLLPGAFERRADKGTSCWLWHVDWLFGSFVLDTQPVPDSQRWWWLCTLDQSWGLQVGPSQI